LAIGAGVLLLTAAQSACSASTPVAATIAPTAAAVAEGMSPYCSAIISAIRPYASTNPATNASTNVGNWSEGIYATASDQYDTLSADESESLTYPSAEEKQLLSDEENLSNESKTLYNDDHPTQDVGGVGGDGNLANAPGDITTVMADITAVYGDCRQNMP
jgi:hypothetical protein